MFSRSLRRGDVRVEVDHGNAFVWVADASDPMGRRIAGIWYRGVCGELIDNREGGSAAWTREVADRALCEAGL